MAEKGQSRYCCCNGCEKPPRIWALDGTDVNLAQTWQRYCCSCVPQYACVLIIDYAANFSTGLYKLYCPPAPEGLEQALYKPEVPGAKISVGGRAIDVAFHFVIVDGECRLCIRSTELGIDENSYGACLTIDAAARANPNFFCKRLSLTDDYLEGATDKDLGQGDYFGVGTEFVVDGYRIILSRADHLAIVGRLPCSDSYGALTLDDHLLRDFCCNCNCICRCMCMIVSSQDGSFAEEACIGTEYNGGRGWYFASGISVEIVRGTYDRTCALRLTNTGSYEVLTEPLDVLIDPLENPCPRPEARWELMSPANDTVPYAHPVFFSLSCSGCSGGCLVSIPGCCESGRSEFPRVLTADVTTTCPACPAFTILLIWDATEFLWIGVGTMCGHPIELKIGCPFTTLSFAGSPCFPTSATDLTATCDPILAEFVFDTGGIGCCGGSSILVPEFTVTVYE